MTTTVTNIISADVLDAAVAEARIRNLRFPRTLDEQIAAVLKPVLASLDYDASVEQHGAMIDAGLAVLRDAPRDEWTSMGFVLRVLAEAVQFFPSESHNIEVTPDSIVTSIVTADAGSDASAEGVAELERLAAEDSQEVISTDDIEHHEGAEFRAVHADDITHRAAELRKAGA